MTNRLPTCDIVIVNWNAGQHLADCLAALNRSVQNRFIFGKIILVDNASTDGSLESAENFEADFKKLIVRNSHNLGFAVACNQGAREGNADYLLFLNPDTRVERESLDSALAFLEAEENAGISVCGAQLMDEAGQISRTCARRPTPRHFAVKIFGLDRLAPRRFESHMLEHWDHRVTRQVDHVMGAFYLIRRVDFVRFNGFDERFFVYLEDLDLSIRLRDSGREVIYLADVRVYHKGGGSSERVKAARLFYSLHSRILYGFKHFSLVTATLLLFGTLLIEPLIRIFAALVQGSGSDAWNTVRAMTRLWMALPALSKTSGKSGRSALVL